MRIMARFSIATLVVVLFVLYAIASGLRNRRAGVVTDAELTEARYGGRTAAVLRAIKTVWFGPVFNCVVLAFVFAAVGRLAARGAVRTRGGAGRLLGGR